MEIRDNDGILLLALTNANGGIIILPDKRAQLFISDDDTRPMVPAGYNYDLLFERNTDGYVTPLLKGRVTVKALVTLAEP